MSSRGQAIVEFAIVFPVLLFTILGAVEAGFLLIAKADQDRSTQLVADWAADHPGESWNSVSDHVLSGCVVSVVSPSRDVLEVTSECPYEPRTGLPMFDLTIGSQESAAVTPVASPS